LAPTILVRYGELALKSPPVRREFEHTLQRNILEQFQRAGLSCRLRADHGHLYVTSEAGPPAVRLLRRVFGVTSVSEVTEVGSDRAEIAARLLELAEPVLAPESRFAVRARRTGSHPFTSQELAGELGGAVLEQFADRRLSVDLDHPQVELHVEVRGPRTYLSLDRYSGPGGLPLGVAGSVVALVDAPRGALGAYLMMKRGCRCAVVYSGPGERLAREILGSYDPRLRAEPCGPDAEATLGRIADAIRADAVVLPLPVEAYPEARAHWGERVLFSPTVAFTDEEVAQRWRGIEELAV
jgi:thiamine biosynthesis protein ThiI